MDPKILGRFVDSLGRNWLIEITVNEIRLLRKELNLDLLALVEERNNLMARFSSDPVFLVDTISLLLTEQIKERGLDEVGFAKGLRGQGLADATDALMEAISAFFTGPKGALILAGWEKTKSVEELACNQMQTILKSDKIERQVIRNVDERMQKVLERLNGSSIDLVESPASNPGATSSGT